MRRKGDKRERFPSVFFEMDDKIISAAFNEMSERVYQNAISKGFKDGITKTPVAELIANIHGETSELWEAYRNSQLNSPCDKAEEMKAANVEPLTCAEEEIADIIIRALDTARDIGIDVGRAVLTKAAFNATRSTRHGGKLA